MNVRSDMDSTVHRPSFTDAQEALCGRRIKPFETWWLADDAELTCEECRAATEERKP